MVAYFNVTGENMTVLNFLAANYIREIDSPR